MKRVTHWFHSFSPPTTPNESVINSETEDTSNRAEKFTNRTISTDTVSTAVLEDEDDDHDYATIPCSTIPHGTRHQILCCNSDHVSRLYCRQLCYLPCICISKLTVVQEVNLFITEFHLILILFIIRSLQYRPCTDVLMVELNSFQSKLSKNYIEIHEVSCS